MVLAGTFKWKLQGAVLDTPYKINSVDCPNYGLQLLSEIIGHSYHIEAIPSVY